MKTDDAARDRLHASSTVADRIADRLMDHIRDEKLVAGDQLPSERELMREFNISRLACREAFAKLRGMGIIRVRHGKGVFLADPQEMTLPGAVLSMLQVHGDIANENILEIRELMEPSAARWAAQRGSEAQKREILRQAEAMQSGLSTQGVVEQAQRFAQADVAFHQAVVAASGNAVLPMVFRGLHELLLRVRLEVLILKPSILQRASADHMKIAQAIASGDPKASAAAMERHIRLRGKELLERTTGGKEGPRSGTP